MANLRSSRIYGDARSFATLTRAFPRKLPRTFNARQLNGDYFNNPAPSISSAVIQRKFQLNNVFPRSRSRVSHCHFWLRFLVRQFRSHCFARASVKLAGVKPRTRNSNSPKIQKSRTFLRHGYMKMNHPEHTEQ